MGQASQIRTCFLRNFYEGMGYFLIKYTNFNNNDNNKSMQGRERGEKTKLTFLSMKSTQNLA